jgi:hypothetical protein
LLSAFWQHSLSRQLVLLLQLGKHLAAINTIQPNAIGFLSKVFKHCNSS